MNVTFVGSCPNGRFSDFEAVAQLLAQGDYNVSPYGRALVVPGSNQVRYALIAAGYDMYFGKPVLNTAKPVVPCASP